MRRLTLKDITVVIDRTSSMAVELSYCKNLPYKVLLDVKERL